MLEKRLKVATEMTTHVTILFLVTRRTVRDTLCVETATLTVVYILC